MHGKRFDSGKHLPSSGTKRSRSEMSILVLCLQCCGSGLKLPVLAFVTRSSQSEVSDLISSLIKEIIPLQNISLLRASSYFPRIDGQDNISTEHLRKGSGNPSSVVRETEMSTFLTFPTGMSLKSRSGFPTFALICVYC